DRANTVSVGDVGAERQITNVADGTEATDAVNLGQLEDVAGNIAQITDSAVQYDDADKGVVTFAGDNGTLLTNVAAGDVSEDSTDAVNGSQLFETNSRVGVDVDRVDDLDLRIGGVEGAAANAVAYSDAERATVELAGVDGTRISNLSARAVSVDSMDAINGGQLHATAQSVADARGGGAVVTAFGTVSTPGYVLQGNTYYSVGDTFAAIDI